MVSSCCYSNDVLPYMYAHRALQPPVHKPSWYCCIRVITSNKLVGFISGVPAVVSVKGQYVISLLFSLYLLLPVGTQDKDNGRNQFPLCS